jgi:hypothetical protein
MVHFVENDLAQSARINNSTNQQVPLEGSSNLQNSGTQLKATEQMVRKARLPILPENTTNNLSLQLAYYRLKKILPTQGM